MPIGQASSPYGFLSKSKDLLKTRNNLYDNSHLIVAQDSKSSSSLLTGILIRNICSIKPMLLETTNKFRLRRNLMSVNGVQTRMLAIIENALQGDGTIDAEKLKNVVHYARGSGCLSYLLPKKRTFTAKEYRAILQPSDYLSNKFSASELKKIKFTQQAFGLLQDLAHQKDMTLLPGLPVAKLNASLIKSTALGARKDWKVRTTAAELKFSNTVGDKAWPALVLDTIEFEDKHPKNLIESSSEKISTFTTAKQFSEFVAAIQSKETDYLMASGEQFKTNNELYGIRNIRRQKLLKELLAAIETTQLSPRNKRKARGRVTELGIKLVTGSKGQGGTNYTMEVGTHKNYWPYWKNYAKPLEKLKDQEPLDSDGDKQISNRLRDIYRRKTANNRNRRKVDEQDFESSINMALVYSPQYSTGAGHRVSQSEDSTRFDPKYELLTVQSDGLPEELQEFAGLQLFRDNDGKIGVDYMGDGDSKARREQLGGLAYFGLFDDHIDVKKLSAQDTKSFSLRYFQPGESARKDISLDWDGNGKINVANIAIGWWGHCHNEAPLNAMGVNPQKSVSLYRANRDVAAEKALKTYSKADVWDIVGAFASDHESGYKSLASGWRSRVNETTFVGERNNGRHSLKLKLKNGRTISSDAELRSFVDKDGQDWDIESMFREFIEDGHGTFARNPLHLSSITEEADFVSINASDSTMKLKIKFQTLNDRGFPKESTTWVVIDPSKDKFVKVFEEIASREPSAALGGKVTEHYYNPKTKEYYTAIQKVTPNADSIRTLESESEKLAVTGLVHTTESQYDSSQEIFNYFLERPGLPKTYDTDPGRPVWNYPVNREQVDLLDEVTKIEM
ncbi:MAG: hypothetical protein VYA34_14880, partial [Myxococcota bacterium]|nr:hypothetical protein [Myxococcota bacterium]